MKTRLLVLAVALGGCGAPPPAPPLPAKAAGEREVLDALEARVKEVLGAIRHPTDRESHEEAVPSLRRRLLHSLGLERLPKPAPSNVRSLGVLDRGDHRIEKLVYETLPGADVPAHLYLPAAAAGKLPAILFVPGHWYADSKAKPDFQAFCINMARRGFAVLSYDPFGQGERGISLRDHRRTELLLAGVAQQAIVDFESLCALEILRARPEVDPERIGITGASGGGYNSWVLAALDPRIKVSVPVVGTSEFHEQIRVVRERDWYDAKEHCHFIPGLLRYANNHEFLAMIAPRPVMVIAAHNDHGFRIPGNREVVEYGRKLYAALGVSERVGYFEDESEGHGYGKRKREAAYGWFLKWLKGEGDGSAVAEPPTQSLAWESPELRCFPPGENRPAGPALWAQASLLVGPPPKPGWAPPRSVIRKSMVDALGTVEEVADGLALPARRLNPSGEPRGLLVACADQGAAAVRSHPSVKAALEAGFQVCCVDPRGMGALATTKPGWTFATSLLLGENFVGRQAMDLVQAWRVSRPQGKPAGFLGAGPNASLAATYAAMLEPRAAFLVADGGFASYRSFIERPKSVRQSFMLARPGEEKTVKIDREIPAALVPFDVLRRFDLADLYGAVLPRPVLVSDPIDGDWAPLSEESARAAVSGGRHAWKQRPEVAVGADAARYRAFFESVLARVVLSKPLGVNPSTLVPRGKLPRRVHVVEDYETGIERRWWLCGARDDAGACRATPAHDFDDKMGDPAQSYAAVVFNPVPGPPMGPDTRLSFRYWIRGSDQLRVQIYSLSKGYHRQLLLSGLAQGEWREGCVDMTQLRRPDGSGGALAEDERIDDIQFYASPDAELRIDDIALFDVAPEGEREPFPSRFIFTGGFDTGRQGGEWPGDFEIVPHEKPRTWKAAKSVTNAATGELWLRISMRGERPVGGPSRLRFYYRLVGADSLRVALGRGEPVEVKVLQRDAWSEVRIDLPAVKSAEEIRFLVPKGAELQVDDVLLYVSSK